MELPNRKANPPKANSKTRLNDYARYSGMAFQMMAAILVFTWLGYQADKYLKLSFPVFLLIGIFFGIGGTIYSLLKQTGKK